jgi:predicted DNA-binding transcriptional regulator AlpA
MDLRELVDLLGISLTVGYELARQDKLPIPTIRVGRQFRFSRAAYDALARAQHGPDRKTA